MRQWLILLMIFLASLFGNGLEAQVIFEPTGHYYTGNGPRSVCAGDLDGDGDSDLAVANHATNDVSILLNNGDGSFATAISYGAGAAPQMACLGDLDGDEDLDMVVVTRDSDNIYIGKV